jgi:hypothetical protein
VPIWQYEDSVEVIEPASNGESYWPVSFEDGSFMGLSYTGSAFSTTTMAPSGTTPAVSLGGFSHWAGYYAFYSIGALATQSDRALVSIVDAADQIGSGVARADLVLLHRDGRAVWSRPVSADKARFLANGDLIIQSGAQLSRLSGNTGAPIWQTNLAELDPDTSGVDVNDLSEAGSIGIGANAEKMSVLANFSFQPRHSTDRYVRAILLLDVASGAIDWRVSSDSGEFESIGCGSLIMGASIVSFEYSDGATLHARARTAATGAAQWRSIVPLPANAFSSCSAHKLIDGFLVAIVGRNNVLASKFSNDGQLLWSRSSPVVEASIRTPSLLANSAAMVVIADTVSAHVLDPSSGALLRSIPIRNDSAGRETRVKITNTELIQEFQTSNGLLTRARYALGTGLSVDEQSQALQAKLKRSNPVHLRENASGPPTPFVFRPEYGPNGKSLTLRKLDPETGLVVHSSAFEVPLDAPIASASLLRIDDSFALVQVRSARAVDNTSTISFARLDLATQTPLWVRSWRSVNSGAIVDANQIFISHNNCEAVGPCSGSAYQKVSLLNVATGNQIAEITVAHSTSALNQNSIVLTSVSGPDVTIRAFDTTGASLWTSVIPMVNGLATTFVNKLSTFGNDFLVELSDSRGSIRQARILRIAGATGQTLWQRAFAGESSIVSNVTNDGILFSTRVNESATIASGRFHYLDAATGATRFNQIAGGLYFRTLRPIADGKDDVAPVRRFFGYMNSAYLPSSVVALSLMNYQTQTFGAEHLYVSNLGDSLKAGTSVVIHPLFRPEAIFANLIAPGPDGTFATSLQRWPAVSASNDGDLKVLGPADSALLTALGPQVSADLVIRNESPVAVNATLGYVDDSHGSTAVLRACRASAGSICPLLGTGANVQARIAAGGQLNVQLEITDPGFAQHRCCSSDRGPVTGYFFALPDYTLGDQNLDNNVIRLRALAKAFGDGFE